MFDLAYTLESYDLIATEGVFKAIGRGVKAVIDFIIRKIKGAIAFLTGKKKKIQNGTKNSDFKDDEKPVTRNKFAKAAGKTINREKASQATLYANDMSESIKILWSGMAKMEYNLGSVINKFNSVINTEANTTDESKFSTLRDEILSRIEEIDSEIDITILPSVGKLNRAKNLLFTSVWENGINQVISNLSDICAKWQTLQKKCENIETSHELTQMISKTAQVNARIVDIVVKVTNTLSTAKYVSYDDPEWKVREIWK